MAERLTGNNHTSGSNFVTPSDEDRAFDRLPRGLRLFLIAATYDFSAQDVLVLWKKVGAKQALATMRLRDAQLRVVEIIRLYGIGHPEIVALQARLAERRERAEQN